MWILSELTHALLSVCPLIKGNVRKSERPQIVASIPLKKRRTCRTKEGHWHGATQELPTNMLAPHLKEFATSTYLNLVHVPSSASCSTIKQCPNRNHRYLRY